MIFTKFFQLVREEFGGVHPRYLFAQFIVALLPHNAINRVRTSIYRAAGLNIGKNSLILGSMTLLSTFPLEKMLAIGERCRINAPLYIELTAQVTIGNDVGIGHNVVMITTDHETASGVSRAGRLICSPITIEDGAWIGAGSIIMPGVTIGAGAVVAAGSLVTHSVLPHRVVAGVPARVVKTLTD